MTADDVTWMDHAICLGLDPDLFFPPDEAGQEVASGTCETCPVIDACAEYALTHRIHHGVWGGMTERQRRVELRRRGAGTRRPGPTTTRSRDHLQVVPS